MILRRRGDRIARHCILIALSFVDLHIRIHFIRYYVVILFITLITDSVKLPRRIIP